MFRRLLIISLALALPARANLGETVDQCVKRYGRPIGYSEANARIPFGTIVFVAGGYTLLVFLAGAEEVGARVSKADKSAFSSAELKTIMDADAPVPWIPTPTTQPQTSAWQRGDGATLYYDQKTKMVIFTSAAMTAALKNSPQPTAPNLSVQPATNAMLAAPPAVAPASAASSAPVANPAPVR